MARTLAREPFLVLALAANAAAFALATPRMLGPDGWLALVAGREVREGGIPRRDTLTAWSRGAEWIDQQWLGQLLLHELHALGGLRLALLANAALLMGGLAIAAIAARRVGASSTSVALLAVPCLVTALPNSALRPQSLAVPLFAGLLWLLLAEARRPSRRVLLAAPLLALWANLHGSVVLAAALVALLGVVEGAAALRAGPPRARRLLRPAGLAALPWPLLLASPYGPELVGYYRDTLWNPAFRELVTEWQPATLPGQAPVFALALGGLWLLARPGRSTVYARLAFVALLVLGLGAVRNGIWLALAAAAVLPSALDDAWRPPARELRRGPNLALAGLALAGAAAAVVVVAAQPASWYERGFPPEAARAVAAEAARDADARVFANERFADWLLWREPELAGRVAYDTRFELLPAWRLRAVSDFRHRTGTDWARAAEGHSVIVLALPAEAATANALLAESGTRTAYLDRDVAVLVRGAAEA